MPLQTGDLLFFHGTAWYSYLLEWLGKSRMSHVGIYVYDPARFGWPHPIAHESASKEYVLHAGYGLDAESSSTIFGVHLEPLTQVMTSYATNDVWVRCVNADRDEEFYRNFLEAHSRVHNKPYDTVLRDWVEAAMRENGYEMKHQPEQRTDRFWCSALVAYVYVQLGWLSPDLEWTLVTPGELASDRTKKVWHVPVDTLKPY